MPSIISKVTKLDKEMRNKVQSLQDEREKLPLFLRGERKRLSEEVSKEAKEKIKAKKKEIEKGIKEIREIEDAKLKTLLNQAQEYYENNKDEWINNIYKQCIDDYLED